MGDGEAQSGASVTAAAGTVQPGEAFEDPFPFRGRDAGAVVADRQFGVGGAPAHLDQDGMGGMALGVVEQVAEQPAELTPYAVDHDSRFEP
ncbi:hypothetical protein Pmi06nite_32760 [Planotetraspora mira]|uniref:Uncharacterized protein n=1 Tax=Planotetraspora mira TaxID=58121 RepID=A0A8J3TSQ5_9ACTN|nr:hypothetical protein Pmi06nite_32760 [Planotetraspora mira]